MKWQFYMQVLYKFHISIYLLVCLKTFAGHNMWNTSKIAAAIKKNNTQSMYFVNIQPVYT